MGKLLCVAMGVLLSAASLTGQCNCSASTQPVNPMLVVPGPPAWSVGGTLLDFGTTSGRCLVLPFCADAARPCKHGVIADVFMIFPANTTPLPTLTVELTSRTIGGPITNRVAFDLPPSSGTVNANGTWTYSYQYPVFTELTCGQSGTISLVWAMPGGAAKNQSGSVALSCGNC